MPSTTLKTPIGVLRVAANEKGVTAVDFPANGRTRTSRRAGRALEEDVEPADAPAASRAAARRHLAAAVRQLEEYFAGTREGFDLDLFMNGTDFEARVWRRLARIPHGETCTYAEIARATGAPGAARAAGAAIGKNPIPIIVPCHRVIGVNGSLTGFGGGLDRKRWLLAHESGQRELPTK
jgi:methylated-DNA-[protein]-cysteine S-methyltransferase